MAETPPIKARERFLRSLGLRLIVGKPVRFFCTHCGKYIGGDMPWICGYCDFEHQSAIYYSVLNKCKNCKKRPRSVLCPHCDQTNFLDDKKDDWNPARRLGAPLVNEYETEVESKRTEERLKIKEDLKFKIEKAELRANLSRAEREIQSAKPQKPFSRTTLRESLAHREAMHIEVDRIVAEKKQDYAKHFAGNRTLLRKALEMLEQWREDEIRKNGL